MGAQWLDNNLHDMGIGRGDWITWPPDIYLWMLEGKSLYHRSLGSQQLINDIEVAAANRNLPRQLVTVRGSIQCHCEVCSGCGGATLNICYLLQYTFTALTRSHQSNNVLKKVF
jgi:hypothetical protein